MCFIPIEGLILDSSLTARDSIYIETDDRNTLHIPTLDASVGVRQIIKNPNMKNSVNSTVTACCYQSIIFEKVASSFVPSGLPI